MRKPKIPKDVLDFFRKTGSIGGKVRAERYTKEQLSAWARLGGRPKGPKKTKTPKKEGR